MDVDESTEPINVEVYLRQYVEPAKNMKASDGSALLHKELSGSAAYPTKRSQEVETGAKGKVKKLKRDKTTAKKTISPEKIDSLDMQLPPQIEIWYPTTVHAPRYRPLSRPEPQECEHIKNVLEFALGFEEEPQIPQCQPNYINLNRFLNYLEDNQS